MVDDAELLRCYAGEKSEAAFADLVQRHVDLVYSAALRRLQGDAHAAADVTQQVFTALARQAPALARESVVLPAWLYRTTRNVAVDFVRTESRRRAREQEAHTMSELDSNPAPSADWSQMRPLLDDAMDQLNERDREAVLLRFFAHRPFAAIGQALNVSGDAARMRVERAVEKLRVLLARRGITSTSAALGTALGHHAVAAAPAGFAGSVSAHALATTPAGIFAFMTTTQAAAVAVGLGLAIAVGAAFVGRRARTAEMDSLMQARANFAALVAQRDDLARRVSLAAQDAIGPKNTTSEKRAGDSTATAGAPATVSVPVPTPARNPIAEGDAFMARHPAVREALIDWATAVTNSRWGAFFREVNLTPRQVAEFQALRRALSFLPGVEEDGRTLLLYSGLRISTAERESRMREVLGDDAYQKYQDHERTLPARDFAGRLAGDLCFSESPLTPVQYSQLVDIIDRSRSAESGEVHQFDWDGVMARARPFLSEAQLVALNQMRDIDRFQQAWDRAPNPYDVRRSASRSAAPK